jgi:6,7-dimethyl-8-ribityllumazine synthase
MIEITASPEGAGRSVAIVVSRFNELVTRELLAGAHETLLERGVADDAITVAWVPGAWEIPSALARLARLGRFDALIALGAVIRGETPHFDFVAGGAADGTAAVAAAYDVPVIFGVLTTDNLEQALERAGGRGQENKGRDCALAALEMANLFDRLAE